MGKLPCECRWTIRVLGRGYPIHGPGILPNFDLKEPLECDSLIGHSQGQLTGTGVRIAQGPRIQETFFFPLLFSDQDPLIPWGQKVSIVLHGPAWLII